MTVQPKNMEESIFAKLPSGGSWWNIRHPEHVAWQQQPYEEADAKVGVILQQRKARAENDAVETEAPSTQLQGALGGGHAPKPKEPRKTYVFHKLLGMLDPCASLYTSSQRADALQHLRGRLLAFVSGPAHPYLGPKRSRVLSIWLSGNRVSKDNGNGTILEEFLQFLTDGTAWNLDVTQHGDWYVKN